MKVMTSRWSKSLVAVVSTTTLLAGCGDNNSGSSTEKKQAPITLRIELFDRNNTPAGAPPITNNFMTKYIQENFGDPNNIKVQFETVPRTQEVEKLNVLMAAGQAPDLVYTYDTPTVQKYVKDGGLTDLGPLVEKYGQNLKKVLGSDVLSYGVFEDKQYAIPARRMLLPQSTTLIRQDWLEEVGLPVPKTTEEFYNTLKAFKEKKPGKSGDKVIPYSNIDPFHMKPLQYSFWEWDKISDSDLFAMPEWLLPGNKEGHRFLNKLYNEGLIDRDFPLTMNKDFQKFQKDLISGVAGAGTANTNEPVYQGYLAEISKADPKAKLIPIDPFTTPKGKHPKALYSPNGMYMFVPSTSKNAEAVVKYLDWMAQPKNIIALQNGTEGKTYEMKDGIPQTLDNEEAKQTLYNYPDYNIILNGKFVSTTDENLNIAANASDPKYKDFTISSIKLGSTDGVIKPNVNTPIQSEIKYAATLKAKNDEIFVKVITAKPADFDKVYDAEVNDYMKIGGQEVMDEKRKAFEANKK
ncbi:extracellular solute-binding protein [Paenibacillus sp. OAS669]|uniref:extracellular solute-binding protein n=1 Tax=Paenibacillus sp. OAS669 TaxID=2663821 RepID=UPI00178C0E40|nr:extracellular solute-binding protein [Paenibacillus sp. OAS669]MBE1440598.1 putative aldouronate transport system substrate-binding protein [Paenibacillus sp. OAS669]